MKESIQLKDGQYELSLPWKISPPSLPWNRPVTGRRLKVFKIRLENDNNHLKKYSTYMDDLTVKDYARKVPNEHRAIRSDATWYATSDAAFALRQTADDNNEQFDPETVKTVKRNL